MTMKLSKNLKQKFLIRLSCTELLSKAINFACPIEICKPEYSRYLSARRKSFVNGSMLTIYNLDVFVIRFKMITFILIQIISKRGKILFCDDVENNYLFPIFRKISQFFLLEKWPGGFLSNFKNLYYFTLLGIAGKLKFYKKFHSLFYVPKSQMPLNKKKYFVTGLLRVPNIVIIPGPTRNFWAYKEASSLKIPAITLLDGVFNKSHNKSFIFLPCNINSLKSLNLVAHLLGMSVLKGYKTEMELFFFLLKKKKRLENYLNELKKVI